MKKCTLSMFLALLFASASLFATVHTVSNNQNSPGQFTSLQDAIDAASAGDTIYVSGSPTTYGNATLNKQLTLIGAGYNPDNQFQLKSALGSLTLGLGSGVSPTNPNGSRIMGFDINSLSCNTNDINNITVYLNKINSISYASRPYTGWIIKNNIINSLSGSQYATNILVLNNIISGTIYSFESTSVLISNNIFPKASSTSNFLSSVQYAVVTNNIIYGLSTGGCNYCTFNNNISIGGNQTTFVYANNTGENNFENINPLFVNAPEFNFSLNFDYHLAGGSPGIDAGTDGSDIGIYGGNYAFPSGGEVPYQTSPVPPIPQVVNMNILNSVLPEGGTLQVEVEGKSQL